MSSNKVIIFSAPSGSGKTTLVRYCLENFPQLRFSVSATTRKPRGNEKDGVDYYFFTPEDFRKKIAADRFVEYEEVYPDKFYGTLKSEVTRIWEEGNVVIFDVDVKGGVHLKKIFGTQALSVFIAPPDMDALHNRLVGRGTDDEASIQMRLKKAAEEMEYRGRFDRVLVNDDLSAARQEIKEIVQNFLNQ